MMRKMMCMAVAVLLMGVDVAASPKKQTSSGRVGQVVTFPLVHPVKTVKGILYGLLNVVGMVVDKAEFVTDKIAKGAAKLDGAVDTLEGKTNPAPGGQASGKQHSYTPAP